MPGEASEREWWVVYERDAIGGRPGEDDKRCHRTRSRATWRESEVTADHVTELDSEDAEQQYAEE
ncbi:hypothetical protein OSTOST_03129 [Ostertagia ostertagi]